MKRSFISIVFMVILLSMSVHAGKFDFLTLESMENYYNDSEGRLNLDCDLCQMDLNLCKRQPNNGNNFNIDVYDRQNNSVNILDHIESYQIYREDVTDLGNGSFSYDYVPITINSVKSDVNKLGNDVCNIFRIEFQLKTNTSIDIVPTFNDYVYDEYAWFNNLDGGVDSIYFPFNLNDTVSPIESVTVNEVQSNCTIGGQLLFQNDSTSGIFINSSEEYEYGNRYFDGTGDYCTLTTPDIVFNTATSFNFRMWFSLDVGHNTFSNMLQTRSTSNSNGAMFFQTDASNHVSIITQGNGGSNPYSFTTAGTFDDGQPHLLIFDYDAVNDDLFIVIDNNIEDSDLSRAGWTWTSDGARHELGAKVDAHNENHKGMIDEYVFEKRYLGADLRTQIWDVEHISSMIEGTFNVTQVNLTIGDLYQYQYNWSDDIDTLHYYTNDSNSNITDAGMFKFSTNTTGFYTFIVNVTDNYNNTEEDIFVLNFQSTPEPTNITNILNNDLNMLTLGGEFFIQYSLYDLNEIDNTTLDVYINSSQISLNSWRKVYGQKSDGLVGYNDSDGGLIVDVIDAMTWNVTSTLLSLKQNIAPSYRESNRETFYNNIESENMLSTSTAYAFTFNDVTIINESVYEIRFGFESIDTEPESWLCLETEFMDGNFFKDSCTFIDFVDNGSIFFPYNDTTHNSGLTENFTIVLVSNLTGLDPYQLNYSNTSEIVDIHTSTDYVSWSTHEGVHGMVVHTYPFLDDLYLTYIINSTDKLNNLNKSINLTEKIDFVHLPPNKVLVYSPLYGTEIIDPHVFNINWTDAQSLNFEPVTYNVYLVNVTNTSYVMIQSGLNVSEYMFAFPLLDNLDYYIRVETCDSVYCVNSTQQQPISFLHEDVPVLSNFSVGNATTVTFMGAWVTNISANSTLSYREFGSGTWLSVSDTGLSTFHQLIVAGLDPLTTYETFARSCTDDHCVESGILTITTDSVDLSRTLICISLMIILVMMLFVGIYVKNGLPCFLVGIASIFVMTYFQDLFGNASGAYLIPVFIGLSGFFLGIVVTLRNSSNR